MGGKATEKSDTSKVKNEFGTTVACGGTNPYDGPQLYYKLTLTAGKLYRLTLTPDKTFDPALYAFPVSSGCTGQGINAGCKGLVSDVIGKGASGLETMTLKPTTTADWIVVVDSYAATEKGPFTLEISEALPASNDKCAKALVMALAAGKATATGDTSTATNEYGTTITCGTSYDYDGPQLYYRVVLPANKTYKVTAIPKSSWDPAVYAFTDATCTASVMDSQCASWISDSAGPGKAESFFISTTKQQNYIIAIDSYAASQKGAVDLVVEEFAAAPNSKCSAAQALTMVGGTATVNGDTKKGFNEFGKDVKCGGYSALGGPQLYYRVKLTANNTYRISLSPKFPAYLYLFSTKSCASAASLNSECSSSGSAGGFTGVVGSGKTGTLFFTAPLTGDYVLAVDSSDSAYAGTFTLAVQDFSPAANGKCSAAKAITLAGGKASVSGDTSGVANEYAGLKCGASPALTGPQVYYTLSTKAGQVYKLRLRPKFNAYLYLAAKNSCGSISAISSGCGSGGVSGAYLGQVVAGGDQTLYFKSSSGGDFLVAVESSSSSAQGAFNLTLEELTAAPNSTCAKAAALSFKSGQAMVSGDTYGLADQYSGLKCGGAAAMSGPQVYYALSAGAGKTYRLSLYPDFKARLYVFPKGACGSATSVESACSSKGSTGDVAAAAIPAQSGGQIMFKPAAAGDYIVAVDSEGSTDAGSFDLTVSEHAEPTFTAPVSMNFDLSCNGLAATRDWECGVLNFKGGGGCDGSAKAPAKAHSGSGVWGTRLNDCYSAYGNSAQIGCKAASAGDDSVLSFKVAIPAGWTKATLGYWEWDDSYVPFDWSEVRINGIAVAASQTCSKAAYAAPSSWVQRKVDLTAHVGKTISVAFHFSASSVINYAGLYLDDITLLNK